MILDELMEMAAFTRSEIGMGLSVLSNDNFELVGGGRSGSSQWDETRLKYLIFDMEIFNSLKDGEDQEKANVGFVELFVKDKDHQLVGLVNIRLKPKYRKSGRGRQLIKDLVDTTNNGLSIHDIKKSAQRFWAKVGTEFATKAKRDGHIQK